MSSLIGRCLAVGCVVVICCQTSLQADVVRLHSGAEVRGKIVAADKTDKSSSDDSTGRIAVETLSGARIEIAAEAVAFISERSLRDEEYEVRARHTDDTADAQWDLAQWCRENHLKDQQELHANRVVVLDPDHEAARRALGHVWKDGGWVDWNEYMTERGYVKYKGRWITQPELELLQKTSAELAREQDWYPKIRLWTGWITSNNPDRIDNGLMALRAVQDADAAPAIAKLMSRHAVRDVRLLAVNVLTQSIGQKSATALATVSLTDVDAEIRYTALEGIPEEQYSAVEAVFIQKLRSADNAEVNRAAVGLARVGGEESVTPLINALITTHRYQIKVRGSSAPTYSFGTNGSMGMQAGTLPPAIEAGLLTGQYPNGVVVLNSPDPAQNLQSRWVTVQQEQQNTEVLAALQQLTGEDFQYDERTWHLWWAAQKHNGGLSKS